jgi:phosphatidylglycerophosphate synthase
VGDDEQGGTRRRCWILTEAGHARTEVWGVDTAERLVRVLRAAGVPSDEIRVGPPDAIPRTQATWVVFRADHVFDDRLVHALLSSPDVVLVRPGGAPAAAHVEADRLGQALRFLTGGSAAPPAELRVVSPAGLAGAYAPALRRSGAPLLLRVEAGGVAAVEQRIFDASYKGVTDLVTKWLWPAPARSVTRRLARWHVHPNVVTLVSWLLVVLVVVLFARAWFVTGLAAAWLMTFLDTVDGKLARVTLTSSRVGGALDHGLDLVHPPFWYAAWGVGLAGGSLLWGPALSLVVGGYVLGRLIEGVFLVLFGIEIHCWKRLDSRFRLVTARRNPNLILLSLAAVARVPGLGLGLVAAWTVVSVAFHGVRLGQAIVRRTRGLRIAPWLEPASGGAVASGLTRPMEGTA